MHIWIMSVSCGNIFVASYRVYFLSADLRDQINASAGRSKGIAVYDQEMRWVRSDWDFCRICLDKLQPLICEWTLLSCITFRIKSWSSKLWDQNWVVMFWVCLFILFIFYFIWCLKTMKEMVKFFTRSSQILWCGFLWGFFCVVFSAANIWWKKWYFILDIMNRILRSPEHWPSPALTKVNISFDFGFTQSMLNMLAALTYNILWQRLEPENNSVQWLDGSTLYRVLWRLFTKVETFWEYSLLTLPNCSSLIFNSPGPLTSSPQSINGCSGPHFWREDEPVSNTQYWLLNSHLLQTRTRRTLLKSLHF